jgi:carbohydrate-selective porin OprB
MKIGFAISAALFILLQVPASAVLADLELFRETYLELFYKLHLSQRLAFKPDLQYVTDPGGQINHNTSVPGMSFEVLS